MVVIDASVVIAAFCPDESSVRASAMMLKAMEDGAIAPAIFPYEIANVLLVKQRRKILTASQRQDISAVIAGAPIEIIAPDSAHVIGEVGALADKLAISAYDAAYIELAKMHHATLATLDLRLASAANKIGLQLL